MDSREAAASPAIMTLMAGLVFLAAMAFVLFETQDAGKGAAPQLDSLNRQAMAAGILDMLVTTPGMAGDGLDWIEDPDALQRLGLLDARGGHLNFTKFDNLRLARFEAGQGGHVNYPEARESLGLGDRYDFHIRAYPNLKSVQKILETGVRDPNLKVTYIGSSVPGGDGDGDSPGITFGTPTCAASPHDPKVMRIESTIGTSGTQPSVLVGVFDAAFATHSVRSQDNTFRVPAGADAVLGAEIAATDGRSCSGIQSVTVEVHDEDGRLTEETFTAVQVLGEPDSASVDFSVISDLVYGMAGEPAAFPYAGAERNQKLDFQVVRLADGVVVHEDELTVPNPAPHRKATVPGSALEEPGDYQITLKHRPSQVTISQRLYVSDGDEAGGGGSLLGYLLGGSDGPSPEWSDSMRLEVGYLHRLVDHHCPFLHDSKAETPLQVADLTWEGRCGGFKDDGNPGDVFPDLRKDLRKDLRPRLVHSDGSPRYDLITVLVVGSDVDHQPMVHVRHEVAAWVAGGGTLVVFGSEQSNTQWMQAIFHLGIHSSSGGLTVEDESHPVLRVADDLSYDAYDARGQAWKFTGHAREHFTNVISSGDGAETIMGVSDPGAFGSGSVVVTSWFPYDLFNEGSGSADVEGTKFLNNLLMLGYRTLYLDYGPLIPVGREVTPAVAVAHIDHPDLGMVTLEIVLYLFDAV